MNQDKINTAAEKYAENNSTGYEDRYSVSLYYQKTDGNNIISNLLAFITNANSDEEALGKAIEYFSEETKGYSLLCKVIIKLSELKAAPVLSDEQIALLAEKEYPEYRTDFEEAWKYEAFIAGAKAIRDLKL